MIARLVGPGLGLDVDNRVVASPDLSPTEWRAVATALQDATLGRRIPTASSGLLVWFSRKAAGSHSSNIPADPRLDAVRAFVDRARRDRRVDDVLVAPLIQCGFNRRQIEALALLAA